MIMYKDIDEAFNFYGIDSKYKKRCYECIDEINKSDLFKGAFDRVYKTLYLSDFKNISKLWQIKNVNELFADNINDFITNVMILFGYKFHIENIKKYNLDNVQINIHKKRVKECFESDLVNRGYTSVRISQMLWSIYFIRVRILEIGRLQFEYTIDENNNAIIKIHIPKGSKLDIELVKKSIRDSKKEIEKIFKINNYEYICNSWLCSNQIHEVVDKDSNIYKFQELFNVEDGDSCVTDILNFVYNLQECNDYNMLEESTSLQKILKNELLNGKDFSVGCGVLKKYRIVIAGFGCIGKTELAKKDNRFIDLESSKYKYIQSDELLSIPVEKRKGRKDRILNKDFPQNYFNAIMESLQNKNVLISVNYDIIELLKKNNIEYVIVYPEAEMLDEIIERCENRGNIKEFIDGVKDAYYRLLPKDSDKVYWLKSGEYLSDIIEEIINMKE